MQESYVHTDAELLDDAGTRGRHAILSRHSQPRRHVASHDAMESSHTVLRWRNGLGRIAVPWRRRRYDAKHWCLLALSSNGGERFQSGLVTKSELALHAQFARLARLQSTVTVVCTAIA